MITPAHDSSTHSQSASSQAIAAYSFSGDMEGDSQRRGHVDGIDTLKIL